MCTGLYGVSLEKSRDSALPLEHFNTICALAVADEIGLFSDMQKDVAKRIRLQVIDLVLATDMLNHFDLVFNFGAIVAAKRVEASL